MSVYKFKSDKYSSHSKIINLIKELGKNLKILDIGCSTGYLAKRFTGMGNKVNGIEADIKSAKLAKKYCDVIVGDVETLKLNYKKNSFDVILFADILEHLKNPLITLKFFKKYLKEDGMIIISTSNIANWYIRLNLLFGKFEYTDRGILDETHLRFFTLKGLKKLIKEAGFKIYKIDVTPIPLPMLFPSTAEHKPLNFLHRINYFITKLWIKLFAFQFIVQLKR